MVVSWRRAILWIRSRFPFFDGYMYVARYVGPICSYMLVEFGGRFAGFVCKERSEQSTKAFIPDGNRINPTNPLGMIRQLPLWILLISIFLACWTC